MIEQIINAIKDAEENGLLKSIDNVKVTGLSGNKLVGSIQRLIDVFSDKQDTCYLEIGVFQGLTLLHSAVTSSNLQCYGIDNFAFFDPDKQNFNIVKGRIEKLGVKNANLINQDYENALENLKDYIGNQKIGVYFIDGPHDYRSQLMCLQLALPYLHEQAVIIVDDCNYTHVRQANRDFLITHPEYKLVFEAYTQCHPKNMALEEEKEARKGWWNGVNILVRDTYQKLPPMYPPTESSRQLYENEHLIHSSNFAEFAPQTLNLLQSFYNGNLFRFATETARIFPALRKHQKNQGQRYRAMNTYSENLPASNFNKYLVAPTCPSR
jgi:predicted O-methyltransferase YrrM